jgi:hypothetical protein
MTRRVLYLHHPDGSMTTVDIDASAYVGVDDGFLVVKDRYSDLGESTRRRIYPADRVIFYEEEW